MERAFEHVLDDGGMRRAHLREHGKIRKRYLIHVAAFNLGLVLRALLGFGTPKGWADAAAVAPAEARAIPATAASARVGGWEGPKDRSCLVPFSVGEFRDLGSVMRHAA